MTASNNKLGAQWSYFHADEFLMARKFEFIKTVPYKEKINVYQVINIV